MTLGVQAKLADALAAGRAEAEARGQTAGDLDECRATTRQLRELVASLDAERDALSAVVDEKAEVLRGPAGLR